MIITCCLHSYGDDDTNSSARLRISHDDDDVFSLDVMCAIDEGGRFGSCDRYSDISDGVGVDDDGSMTKMRSTRSDCGNNMTKKRVITTSISLLIIDCDWFTCA